MTPQRGPVRPSERFIRVTQEWAHAVSLFGRCNGTDWSVLMTVAHYTWGMQRDSAEVGLAIFRDRLGQKDEAIRQSLAKLAKKRDDGGFGMVRVVQEQTTTKGRVLALEDDWIAWAWESEEDLARCSIAMTIYRRSSKSDVSDWTPSDDAIDLARLLRDHCVGLVPEAEVPAENLTDRRWRRWLQSFEKMLEKRDKTILAGMIRWVHRDTFWSPQILGENADLRLSRNIDTIHARYVAHAQKRRFS